MKNPTKMEISSASRGQRKLAEQSAEELFGVLNDRQSAPLSLDQLTTRFLVAITRARQHSSVEPDTGMGREEECMKIKACESCGCFHDRKYSPCPGDEALLAHKAVDGQTQNEAAYDFAPWKPPFHYDDFASCIIDSKQRKIIDIRGWGFLTGKGHEALGMQEENAEGIQDLLGEYVAKFLNDSSVGARVSSPADGVAADEEIAACPFCSDNNATVMRDAQHMAPYFIVICADCGARTESFQEAKVARVRWNDRASAGRAAQNNGVALERLVRCARANSYTGIPSLVAVMLALPALHHMNGMEGIERLACGVIGVIIGWLAALWATCFLLKYGGSASIGADERPAPARKD